VTREHGERGDGLVASKPYRVSIEDVGDRAAAAFLGFASGDALGATAEFLTPTEIQAQFGVLRDIVGGGWLRLPAGSVTDDTEMSLCIARSIVEVGFSPQDIAERFAAWLKTAPRDVGATCRRGIRRYIVEGTVFAQPSEMDAGNGAVMRMLPIALASVGDSSVLAKWSTAQAHITHYHPLSDAACLIFGQLLHLALVGHGKPRLLALTDDFLSHYPTFKFDGKFVQSSAYVVDTLRTVLRAFFETNTFEDCVVRTVNWGGDADTTGAIVGALAGAYYGLQEIPRRWSKKLQGEVAKEVQRLARDLVARSPVAARPLNVDVPRVFLRGLIE